MTETPGTEAGPVTAAGRALVGTWPTPFAALPMLIETILAIEAEARAQRDAELRVLVDAVLTRHNCNSPGYCAARDDPMRALAAAVKPSDHAHADTPSREGGGGT